MSQDNTHGAHRTHEAHSSEQLGKGVIYKDIVPLKWREIGRDELNFSYLSMQDANEEVLRFIATLEEFHVEVQDEPGSNAAELSRIEFKINLLLDMVTRLVVSDSEVPKALPITLGSTGIEWVAARPPNENSLLELSLYLHHKYPRPFIVIGRVLRVTPMDAAGGCQIFLVFESMSAAVQSSLEKLIFRQHRRSIAQSRRDSRVKE